MVNYLMAVTSTSSLGRMSLVPKIDVQVDRLRKKFALAQTTHKEAKWRWPRDGVEPEINNGESGCVKQPLVEHYVTRKMKFVYTCASVDDGKSSHLLWLFLWRRLKRDPEASLSGRKAIVAKRMS